MHGAGPMLAPLQHHIKTRSPCEDDRAANHSVHLANCSSRSVPSPCSAVLPRSSHGSQAEGLCCDLQEQQRGPADASVMFWWLVGK